MQWTIGARTSVLLGGALFAVVCLASLDARAQAPELQGTSWRLVAFKGGDDKPLTPDDRAKYTLEFLADGRLAARLDCNRGRATWKSSGPGHLELGPLASTRAKCPDGSLDEHIVRRWSAIRAYAIKDGHLFLTLTADGGAYEFERPVGK